MLLIFFVQARGFGTKIIDEDDLIKLIKDRPGKKSKYEIQAEESFKKVFITSIKYCMLIECCY